MKTKEYKRKLKKVKAKFLELVIEAFKGCWTKEDASALGYAVKFIQNLTIDEDGRIDYTVGTSLNNSAKWEAVKTLDAIKHKYNVDRFNK